jgi:uncharacterized membrane-anchored protein
MRASDAHPRWWIVWKWIATALLAVCAQSLAAEETAPIDGAAETAPLASHLQSGPATIALRDQAALELPDGYGFIAREPALKLMESMGNRVDGRFLGLVLPIGDEPWFVSVQYEPSGYIEDDDAKQWDADALLEDLKVGTEAGNERRRALGIPAMTVTGWAEPPHYDATSHRLVWSAEANSPDAPESDPTVNYNTYLLGREGYVSMNLVTSASTVDAHKESAKELLGALTFNEGKRYEDFDASSDKVAAYGLAALIGGVAAKKIGFFAVLAAFFVKFAKVIILGLAALLGVVAKLLGRNKTQ